MTIQMKATEHYFHVALFIILYNCKVFSSFKFIKRNKEKYKSVDETLVCDHLNESY